MTRLAEGKIVYGLIRVYCMQLLLSLVKATYWYNDALMNGLATYGVPNLSRAQSFVVTQILAGERRASSIAQQLGVSRQAISQIIMELVRRDLVMMTKDPDNARAMILDLTPEFRKKGEICAQIYVEIQQELMGRIGSANVEALKTALDMDWGDVPQFSDDHHPVPTAGATSAAAVKIARSGSERRTGAKTAPLAPVVEATPTKTRKPSAKRTAKTTGAATTAAK